MDERTPNCPKSIPLECVLNTHRCALSDQVVVALPISHYLSFYGAAEIHVFGGVINVLGHDVHPPKKTGGLNYTSLYSAPWTSALTLRAVSDAQNERVGTKVRCAEAPAPTLRKRPNSNAIDEEVEALAYAVALRSPSPVSVFALRSVSQLLKNLTAAADHGLAPVPIALADERWPRGFYPRAAGTSYEKRIVNMTELLRGKAGKDDNAAGVRIGMVKGRSAPSRLVTNGNMWVDTADSIMADAASMQRAPVVVICGAKGAGKSTMARYIVNRILGSQRGSESRFFDEPKGRVGDLGVAYLETDVGQPELTPPGVVSLHVLIEPLLAQPHVHMCQQRFWRGCNAAGRPPPALCNILAHACPTYDHSYELNGPPSWPPPPRMYFIGALSSKDAPCEFLTAVKCLVDAYDKGACDRPAGCKWRPPLIVNTPVTMFPRRGVILDQIGQPCFRKSARVLLTNDVPLSAIIVSVSHGWVRGMGYDILASILCHVAPTHVIQFQSSSASKTFSLPDPLPARRLLCNDGAWSIRVHLVCVNDGTSRHPPINLSAHGQRILRLSTYFSLNVRGGHGEKRTRELRPDLVSTALTRKKPCRVPWSAVGLCTAGSYNGGTLMAHPAQSCCALNGAIVGLCSLPQVGCVGFHARVWRGMRVLARAPVLPLADVFRLPPPPPLACAGLAVVRGVDPIAGMWLLLTPENVAVSRKGSAEPFALNVLARGSLHLPAELAFCNNKSRCVKRSCLMTSLGPKRIDQGAQGCAVDECKGVAPYITPNCQKNGCLCN